MNQDYYNANANIHYNNNTIQNRACLEKKEKMIKRNVSYIFLDLLCKTGNIDIIREIIGELKEHKNWDYFRNSGLQEACKGGHVDIVEYLISEGADDWNKGLEGACEGGYMDIVHMMCSKGATNYNSGLFRACLGGYMNAVKYMLHKGAHDYNSGIYGACAGGHMNIFNMMVSLGDDDYGCYEAFNSACYGGNVDIVKLLVKEHQYEISSGFSHALSKGHTEVIKFLMTVEGIERVESIEIIGYNFPIENKKTKYYHNDIYIIDKKNFMHYSFFYWVIMYSTYDTMDKYNVVQRDLIPDLLKLIYFYE